MGREVELPGVVRHHADRHFQSLLRQAALDAAGPFDQHQVRPGEVLFGAQLQKLVVVADPVGVDVDRSAAGRDTRAPARTSDSPRRGGRRRRRQPWPAQAASCPLRADRPAPRRPCGSASASARPSRSVSASLRARNENVSDMCVGPGMEIYCETLTLMFESAWHQRAGDPRTRRPATARRRSRIGRSAPTARQRLRSTSSWAASGGMARMSSKSSPSASA